jgi:hypothetical protein
MKYYVVKLIESNRSRIRKDTSKIYGTFKKCEEAVIQARKISVKNAAGELKENRVEKAKLDFEVTYCYKCKKTGPCHV